MSNYTLNSLRKQLTFDFMLDFTVELTSEEVALLTLFENRDYSGFGTRLGRKEKIEPFIKGKLKLFVISEIIKFYALETHYQ